MKVRMDILSDDIREFADRFPDANNFLIGAELRAECYELAWEIDMVRRYPHRKDEFTATKKARLVELLDTPACTLYDKFNKMPVIISMREWIKQ
jgi:hypothetical protein